MSTMMTLYNLVAGVLVLVLTGGACRIRAALLGGLRPGQRLQPTVNVFEGLGDEFALQASAANDNRRPRRRVATSGRVTMLRAVDLA